MKNIIDEMFEYLSWNNSDEIQKRGIEIASQIKYLSVLIMPVENKAVWENCAKVLANKNDVELERYFIQLFEWLQDMNWPGADIIYDRLICASLENIIPAYEYSISIAKKTQDNSWEMSLWSFFIEYIYNLTDSDNLYEIQSKAIELIKNIKDISLLIQPPAKPFAWEVCAKVLSENTDDILEPHLKGLLEWLQDLNWPGALTILDRLTIFSGERLKQPFIICVTNAINLNNYDGLKWLVNLSELLKNKELKDELPEDIVRELEKHYNDWRFGHED